MNKRFFAIVVVSPCKEGVKALCVKLTKGGFTQLQRIERGICEEPEYQEDTKLLQLACQISSKKFDCYFQVSCTLEDEPFVWHDLRNAQFTLCSVKEQAQTKPENLW